MSWQATAWAATLPHDRVSAMPFRVLLLLANHAHDDGTAAWQSVSSMASTLGVSVRQVQRAVKDLRIQRLIEPGDQRLVNHLPANRRPVVYDLLIQVPIARQEELDFGVTDLSPQPEKLSTGVTSVVVSYKEEPPLNNLSTKRNHRADVTPGPRCPSGHPLIDGYCLYACVADLQRRELLNAHGGGR